MKKFIGLIIILFSTMTYVVYAEEKAVFVFEPYAPFEFTYGGVIQGSDVTLIGYTYAKTDVKVKYIEAPWARAIAMVKSGEADAIFSILYKKERESFLIYSAKPIVKQNLYIVTTVNNTSKINSLSDLKGKTVGVVRENYYGPIFEKNTQILKDESKDTIELLKKLNGDRTQYIIINDAGLIYYANRLNMTNNFKKLFLVDTLDYYIAFSKASSKAKSLAEKFNTNVK